VIAVVISIAYGVISKTYLR